MPARISELVLSIALFVAPVVNESVRLPRSPESRAMVDEAAIRDVLIQQETAWNQADVGKFMEGYWKSPELTFAGANGVNRGWEAVRARYQEQYPDQKAMGKLDFSGLEIRALGPDSALVLGHWHLQREGGELGGVFTLVFQRFSEGWRIVHDHTSVDRTIAP
jgi:uncharacterized protein (TIGR02246 family)